MMKFALQITGCVFAGFVALGIVGLLIKAAEVLY